MPSKVWVDPDRIHQVLGNLLDNAIKFTPEAGAVELRVVDASPKTRFEVRDSGPGIPGSDLPNLFGPEKEDAWTPQTPRTGGRTHAEELEPICRRGRPNHRRELPCRRPREESQGPASGYRQLAICVYNLAAEMERRIDKLGVGWVVSPEVFNAKIVLEVTENDDEQAAGRFVMKVLGDTGLT